MNDLRHDPDATPKPSGAFANIRERFGAYFDAIPDADAFVREQRGGGALYLRDVTFSPTPASDNWLGPSGKLTVLEARDWQRINGHGDAPDLRTADQRHADELAELRERIEAIETALHTQANTLQVLWLEREARGPRP